MPNILIQQTTMTAIADAIRTKLGETVQYLPNEMPAKILSITSGTIIIPGDGPTDPKDITLFAHSPNVDDAGNVSGVYANNLDYVETFTIPGAEKLKVVLKYSLESTSYDWVCVWKGADSSLKPSTNYSTAITPDGMSSPKIGGGTKTTLDSTVTIYVEGDSVTIGMRSDSSQGYAGYYAVITAVDASEGGSSGGGGETLPAGRTPVITGTNKTFDWGSETAVGDATWWKNLQAWVTTCTAANRASVVGKKKYLSLNGSMVQGAEAIQMICVGADQDDGMSLTFCSAGLLPNQVKPGALYNSNSAIRQNAQLIQSECGIATYMKALSRTDGNGNTFTDKVFVPSNLELGAPQGTGANAPRGKAAVMFDSFAGWTYFDSNSKRVMYRMNSSGALTSTLDTMYWTRTDDSSSGASGCYGCIYNNGTFQTTGTGCYAGYSYTYSNPIAFVIG